VAGVEPTVQDRTLARPRWLSDALLVALVTFSGYCFSYWFERGAASTLGFPDYLIELSLTPILLTIMSLAGSLATIVVFANFFIKRLGKTHAAVHRKHIVTAILAAFVFAIASSFGFRHVKEWGIMLYLFVFYAYLIYLDPLISEWGKGSAVDRYKAQDDSRTPNYWDWLSNRFGYGTSVVLTFIFLGFILSYYVGKADAYARTRYLINPVDNSVVIRRYGDLFIIKKYDRSTKQIVGPIRLLRTGDLASGQFDYQDLGEKIYRKVPGLRIVVAYTRLFEK
jgi:hypothetical protein